MTDAIHQVSARSSPRTFESRRPDASWKAEDRWAAINFLEEQFHCKPLPAKPATCIRPAAFDADPRWAGAAISKDGFRLSAIKQALLYSNEVALDVSPILAHARSARRTRGGSGRQWRELIERMVELTEISSLLRTGFILPFSGHELSGEACIGGLVDPLFASTRQAERYVESLGAGTAKFVRSNIQAPLRNSLLAVVPTISSDAVSWSELIVLRRNEEMFACWRELIYSVLNELHSGRCDSADARSGFSRTTAERLREWRERAEARRRRSTALQRMLAGARQLEFRWVAAQRMEDPASRGHHILVLTE